MTEEIIIDCAFYKDGVCASPINKTCEYCKNIDVSKCYHKQLKRLEQENNSLQAQLNNITVQSNNAITALEQENKQMKSALEEIREKIKSLNKDICNNCGWYNTDNCQPNGYVCHDLIEIKDKINEVLK